MPNKVSKRFIHWLPPAVWAALIFCASSIPGSQIQPPFFPLQDKLVHAAIYYILGMLILGALNKAAPGLSRRRKYLTTFLAVLFYGASDEFHQSFVPLRDPSFWDAFADTLGGSVAIAISHIRCLKYARGRQQ